MYLFVYKTTHVNGKYYIGRHQTENLNDGYLGSGKWVKSIKDKSTLSREILAEATSIDELKNTEQYYIDLHWDDPLCMNRMRSSDGITSEISREFAKTNKIKFIERYGVDSSLKIPEAKEKFKNTCIKNWGYDHHSKSQEIKDKKKETCLRNWGQESHNKSEIIKERKKQTCLEKYGADNVSKLPEIKEKKRETCLHNHGVDHPSQSQEIKDKKIQTSLENWGQDHPMKSDAVKEKSKNTSLERYGVEHHNKRFVACRFCGEHKNIKHQDFCTLNPDKKTLKGLQKTFIINSPENKTFEICGGLKKFCEEHNISLYKLKHGKLKGWSIKEK